MYARGMSTREIRGHLRELYGIEVSPDLVSAVTDAVLDEVAEWQNRPLEALYPLVFLDALRVKVRDEGTVRNKAVYVALGVRADGAKEVLGLWIEQTEGAKFWLRVMNELKDRGVADILIAVVDGPEGLPRGDRRRVPEDPGPGLHRPLIRSSLDFVSYKDRKAVAAALKEVYRARTAEAARRRSTPSTRARGAANTRSSPSPGGGTGGGDPVLCLSRRCAPDHLHHEFH
jgi:putative transposase